MELPPSIALTRLQQQALQVHLLIKFFVYLLLPASNSRASALWFHWLQRRLHALWRQVQTWQRRHTLQEVPAGAILQQRLSHGRFACASSHLPLSSALHQRSRFGGFQLGSDVERRRRGHKQPQRRHIGADGMGRPASCSCSSVAFFRAHDVRGFKCPNDAPKCAAAPVIAAPAPLGPQS